MNEAPSGSGPNWSDAIDRHDWDTLGPERYQAEYVQPLRPVVITGALKQWPALTKWTPEFFRDTYPDMPVVASDEQWTMGSLVERVLTSTPENPAPYLTNLDMEQWPAELQADILPIPACTEPNWVDHRLFPSRVPMRALEFFLGGPGARFPVIHYDQWHLHAFLMQVYGVKEYLAFPPDQAEYLYPVTTTDGPPQYPAPDPEGNLSAVDNIENPDLTQFPLTTKASGIRFRLHPGELLFVPSGWWHTARLLTPSITVSINGVNAVNWKSFKHDFLTAHGDRSPSQAAVIKPYLALFESTVIRKRRREARV